MNFIGPKVSDSFLEFIDEGFRKFNNKPHVLTDVVCLMKNLSKYFEACYEIMISTDTTNINKICEEANIELIPSDALKVDNFFEGVTLIIICPIVGRTIFVRVINKVTHIEVFENLLGGAAINNLLTDEEKDGPFGIYTKDILFVRTSGAPKGSAMLAYREDRFHIYNKSLIDLDYDDVALDPKIGYSYLASVFESLYKEIFNNLNHFYIVKLDNKVE